MSEERYYTPTIDEFYVGFEYQIEDLNDDAVSHTWRDQVFDGEETRTYFVEELGRKEMRVKYLDKDDIQSLGFDKFNYTYNKEKNLQAIEDENYSHWHRFFESSDADKPAELVLNLQTINPNKAYVYIWWETPEELTVLVNTANNMKYTSDFIFRGFIKNKSELKKLLKQLGI